MKFVRRLPIYAAGLGLAVALLAVAEARDWDGWRLAAAGLIVAIFYIVTILVPLVVREHLVVPTTSRANGDRSQPTNGLHLSVPLRVDQEVDGVLVPLHDGPSWLPATHGPMPIGHSEPQVTAR